MTREDNMQTFMGFRLIESNAVTKRIPRRVHHKRRINKKWLKRYGYKTVSDESCFYVYGDCIIGSPKAIKKLIEFAKGGVQS